MIKGRLAVVPMAEIDFGDRGREDYGDLVSLSQSIKDRGLIHPIAVCEHPTSGGLPYLLLAGGRRFKAHEFAGLTNIECKVFPAGLDELEIQLIELTENLQRENLKFHEEVKMEQRARDLMVKLYGEKKSTSPDAIGVSHTDIAKMLGISHAKLSQDLKLVKTMESFPEIDWDKCKNQAEATKLTENIAKVVVRQDAVKRFDELVGSATTQRDKFNAKLASSYIVGDFFERVKEVPDGIMHFVEVDPPYAIDLQNKKAKNGFGNYSYGDTGYNEVSVANYEQFMRNVFKESFRVMATNSWLVCWYSPDPWHQYMIDWIRDAGFEVRGLPCVWIKGAEVEGTVEKTQGQTMTPARHLGSACEHFFYARKGDPRINKMGRTNVFSHKPVPAKRKVHPTERPLALIADILETFTMEGSRVLVPFAGSGKTLIAAFQAKMMAIGFDLGELHRDGFIELLQREEVL
jgi:ParB/RepB/Spo0J family partition protein